MTILKPIGHFRQVGGMMAFILILLIAVVVVLRSWPLTCQTKGSPQYCGTDYFIFWSVAQEIRNNSSENIYLVTSLSVAFGLLLSKTLWFHYLLLTLPFYCLFLSPKFIRDGKLLGNQISNVFAALSLLAISGLISPLLDQIGLYTFYNFAVVTLGAILCQCIAIIR